MSELPLFPFRKRLNTEITCKADLVRQMSKKQEMEQSRIKFHKMGPFNEKDMLNEMDNDYSQLVPHKVIDLDRTYKISLFTYCQQFYCLEMINYVFPMRVFIKNVRHDGILYIGYDQEYPGIYHQNKFSIFENQGDSQRNYDFKTVINKDMLITLKNKGNKLIRYVYFTFIAGSSLLMFDFKVQFLGFTRGERFQSEAKFKPQKATIRKEEKSERYRTGRQHTEPLKNKFQRSKFPEISKHNHERIVKLEEFQVFEQMPKHYSKATLSPKNKQEIATKMMNESRALLGKKSSSQQAIKPAPKNLIKLNLMTSDVDLKLQEIRRNKEIFQIFKEKDKQLRETASKCKRLIQNYQKAYNQESVRKRKLNKDLATIIYSVIYVSQIHKKSKRKIKKENMKFKIAYLVKKFATKLRKKYQQTLKMQPYRYKRSFAEGLTAIYFEAKVSSKQNNTKAANIVKNTLLFLSPFLALSRTLTFSSDYRTKIILIQRTWRTKYHARISCLLYFINNHLEKMFKEYPHLAAFSEQFYKNKVNRQLCLTYIKDEAEKYRLIYDAYSKKLQQIDQMITMNRQLALENSMIRSKLIIPTKRPIRPMHRFFRNTDILKAMIRTWFQIQHKKTTKKNSQKYLK